MTNEEAVKRLESFRDYLCAGNPIWDKDDVAEVFDKAIESISFRIPLKAKVAENFKISSKLIAFYECPTCGYILGDKKIICPCCGQAISWEDCKHDE